LASVFAVSELVKEGLLNVNVIFLIEGEEESGSIGFAAAVEQHKVRASAVIIKPNMKLTLRYRNYSKILI
jgi:acetylornithine deacetylase/succinyl-diaminopimelate desuccinylase-like protein